MKTVEFAEIEKLYNECRVQSDIDSPMRTTLNTGSLETKLNADYSFINRGFTSVIRSGAVTPSREEY